MRSLHAARVLLRGKGLWWTSTPALQLARLGPTIAAPPTVGSSPELSHGCQSPLHQRSLHTTPRNGKKKDHKVAKPQVPNPPAAAESSGGAPDRPKPDPLDPFNMADLAFALGKIDAHHEEQLRRLRTGGRFNPDFIGRVLVRTDKGSAAGFPLADVAAVVPQGGRVVSVVAHEARFVKPILSAIQASPDFNQQPQRSEDNELELILRIEPERADGLAARVKEMCHAWRGQVRAERQRRIKVHDRWKADKLVITDDKKRLDKEVEKLHDKRLEHIDAKEKEALNQLATKDRR